MKSQIISLYSYKPLVCPEVADEVSLLGYGNSSLYIILKICKSNDSRMETCDITCIWSGTYTSFYISINLFVHVHNKYISQ